MAANQKVGLREATLRSWALVHGDVSMKAHLVRTLWRTGQRAESHLLLRYFRTGCFIKASDGWSAPPREIECSICTADGMRTTVRVPRWKVALFVSDLLKGLPRERGLMQRALGDAVTFFGLTEKQVRDCYRENPQLHSLALHTDATIGLPKVPL